MNPVVPLNDLQRIDRDLQEGLEIRITLAGVSGCGKTSLRQTIKAVMQQEEFEVPSDMGVKDIAQHGTYFLVQRRIPFPKNTSLLVTDLQGLKHNSVESPAIVADDLKYMNAGLFPKHLKKRSEELALYEPEIVENYQHCIALVFSAEEVSLSERDGDELKYMGLLARTMKIRQCPFIIFLTKVDKIPSERLQQIIDKIQNTAAINKAYIFPVNNCTEQHSPPGEETTQRIIAAMAQVASISARVQANFRPSFKMQLKRFLKDIARPYQNASKEMVRKWPLSNLETFLVFLVLFVSTVFYFVVIKRKNFGSP